MKIVRGNLFERKFSEEEREKMASKGTAMKDGSYPITTEQDLKNAIRAYGRAADKPGVKAHIKKRAHALGRTSDLPSDWENVNEVTREEDAWANQQIAKHVPRHAGDLKSEPEEVDDPDEIDTMYKPRDMSKKEWDELRDAAIKKMEQEEKEYIDPTRQAYEEEKHYLIRDLHSLQEFIHENGAVNDIKEWEYALRTAILKNGGDDFSFDWERMDHDDLDNLFMKARMIVNKLMK